MKTRIKPFALSTTAEFHDAVDEIARKTVSIRELETARDFHLQSVRDNYDPTIKEHTARIGILVGAAQKYAIENRAALLPGKAKSTTTALATFGFRLGTPTLKTLSKWNWKKVLVALEERVMSAFIRTKPEVNKELILSAGAKGTLDYTVGNDHLSVDLSEIGVKIVQEEAFFVEAKDKPVAGNPVKKAAALAGAAAALLVGLFFTPAPVSAQTTIAPSVTATEDAPKRLPPTAAQLRDFASTATLFADLLEKFGTIDPHVIVRLRARAELYEEIAAWLDESAPTPAGTAAPIPLGAMPATQIEN